MLFKASVKTYLNVVEYLAKKYSISTTEPGRIVYLLANSVYPWPNNFTYAPGDKFIAVNSSLSNATIAGCNWFTYYGSPVLYCNTFNTYIIIPPGYISVVNTMVFGGPAAIRTYNELERLKIPDNKINFLIKTK